MVMALTAEKFALQFADWYLARKVLNPNGNLALQFEDARDPTRLDQEWPLLDKSANEP